MEEGRQEYKLYVGDIFSSGYADARYSFVSKKLEYALAFDNKRPKGMRVKKETDLTREEREWLLCCKMKINTEYISKYKDELVELLGAMSKAILDKLSGEEDGRKD